MGKTLPGDFDAVTVRNPSTISYAIGIGKLSAIPAGDPVVLEMFDGTPLMIGGVVSRTSTSVLFCSDGTSLPSVTISLMKCDPRPRRKSETGAVEICVLPSNHLYVSG